MDDSNQSFQTWRFRELCSSLETNPSTGLKAKVAKKRLAKNGPNRLTIPHEQRVIFKDIRNCFWGFSSLIFLSAVLSYVNYVYQCVTTDKIDIEYLVAGMILLIIFVISGTLRYVHANNDSELVAAFKALMPKYCTIIREGQKIIVRSEVVVVGDLLVLATGGRIAADVRVFMAQDLVIDNVALSGYSAPIHINPKLSHPDKWVSRNVGFACSHVVKGSGLGIVIATGDNTEVGLMARLSLEPNPMTRMRKHFFQVTYFAVAVLVLVFICLYIMTLLIDMPWPLVFNIVIGLMVSAAPMTMTIMLYFGLTYTRRRFFDKNCYVRNLDAACTLGLTSVICTDLTGTMTMSRMRVSEVFFDADLLRVEDLNMDDINDRFMELVRVSVLCNDAKINPGTAGMPQVKKGMSGNRYDIALLKFATYFIDDLELLRRDHPMVGNKPINNIDHLHVTIHKTMSEDGTEKFVLLMKGDHYMVIDRCTTYAVNDEEILLEETLQDSINSVATDLMEGGRRVYAFGYKELTDLENRRISSTSTESVKEFLTINTFNLRFLGLIATHDPPRANVANAVAQCRSSGIKLVLISRNKANFAKAVAKELGVIGRDSETVEDVAKRLNIEEWQVKRNLITAAVINMKDMEDYDRHHLRFQIQQILLSHSDIVFAATTLEQRHMIVDVCQGLGAVVALVGSSVHDTPAVQRANVGVAKGISSSQTTKSCADIILIDDNFATVVTAIEESRRLFVNIKKALCYVLATTTPQVLSYLAFILLKIPTPMFIYVSIIIDVLVDLVPAVTLFFEKAEEDLMRQMPNVYDDFIINRRLFFVAYLQIGIIEACAAFIAYFIVMARSGFLPITLVGLSVEWYEETVNDVTDSYGQEWTRAERLQLDYKGSSAFFMAIVWLQSANLILQKTGRANLLYHGFENYYLDAAVVYLICMGFLLCEIDQPHYFRVSAIHNFEFFVFVFPCLVLLILIECVRRYLLRRLPGGCLELETYY